MKLKSEHISLGLAGLVALGLFFVWPQFAVKQNSLASPEAVNNPASLVWEAPQSPFAENEEMVIIASSTDGITQAELPLTRVLFTYVRVKDSCGPHFEGACVVARSGPGTDYPIVSRLRNNVVVQVDGKVTRDGHAWFKIIFNESLRYPWRVQGDWYIAADYVEVVLDEGEQTSWEGGIATSTKKIIVDRSEQKLYAYDGDEPFMETDISTGLELSPTPRGTFTVYKKTPSRYMQGPIPEIPGSNYYDLPGVPWNLYFTPEGAVIHGAYWHNDFGNPYSHGCVNLRPEDAEKLYNWATLGTQVIVRD